MTAGLWENWLLPGVWITIQLTLFSAVFAAAVAFGIGIARTSRLWIVRFLTGFYVEIFRGTSALVLMFWLFFVMPLAFGYQLVSMWAAVLALGLTYGAYGSEIVRGAIASVAPAQREAAIALSFTPAQRMRRVILPQAIPEMIPPFNNLLIELLKATALVSAVSVADITFAAQLSRLATGDSLEIYAIILVLYFVLAFVLTRLMRLLERRAKAGIGQAPVKSDKGPLVTRKLSARQESEQSSNIITGGAQ
ncbi:MULTISPECIES: ectoine/hydroxyectoine ABC transporter permease subunit EhuC [Streptomyces]|uniref:Ectoine/hydroxyectoine ABC transporter permease subunit EhuC n=2 Tax=Streptomyces violaceusniger group TaxID=2839105 RepID=A0A499V1V5_9ACTN|nr:MULTISPECIES: ectoine/hydroxyectoine ABC transporter permease subunit EhuC [Streptomyces]BBJ43541.1 ectoine/hydroxyectoine ABC transporter permease subunit EhuC [Streptomyces antimycoticus]SEB97181.1 polar amino acid transport system permease protein [Streptomyces melanosporofaciens]